MAGSSIELMSENIDRMTDEIRIIKAARQDPKVFGELYKLYVEQVFRYLYSRIGNLHEAEDVTAQTFLAAFESFDKFRQDGHFASWLFGIARNKAMDHFRLRDRSTHMDGFSEIPTEDNTLTGVIKTEQAEALSKLIQALPEEDRELIRLRFLADMSFPEIARFLHRNEEAVKKLHTGYWHGCTASWRFQMNEKYSTPQFEESIRKSFGVPEIRSKFVDEVYSDLMQQGVAKSRKARPFLGLRPAWTVTLAIFSLMIIGTLVIGPQRVYAEFLKLFGYIPGVGIVDQSSPIRVLAEPVSVTRDGITVTVTSATLTGDRTQIVYRIFGVPGSAYPDSEDVAGCWPREYLRLADGKQLAQINYGYEPVPMSVNEAVFVIPCISGTLPGKSPENWELPLRFVPAPPDLTVMPVTELSPSPQIDLTQGTTANGTSVQSADNSVTVSKVIETSDGYILIGSFQPQSKPGESFQQTGAMEIHDASGKKVAYTYPQDVNEAINQEPGGTGWAAQFKAAGLVYPLNINFSGAILLPSDSDATAQFTFDAGSNPQPGQVWDLNQQIQLDGHALTLVSITANSQRSYSFNFQVDPKVYSVGVQIEGFTPIGGGGGGGGGLTNGKFSTSLVYAQLPTGELTVDIFHMVLIGDSATWQGQWSPATVRTDLPANPTLQPGVCLTADSLVQVQTVTAGLLSGKALMYEPLDNSDKRGLVLYNLDGSGKQVLVTDASGGIFSPDGSQMAYPAADGIHVMDLSTKAEKVLPGGGAFNMHWSPDGKQIAYIGMGDGIVDSLFIINMDGTPARQISDLSYESVIGWSPDGKLLYFVAPYSGGAAWKVYSYDLARGTTRDLFTIENGTPKFLNPMLSPDGNWIAYRGRDNSSLYLVHPDSSDMHLVLDNVGAVGIAWTSSGWLGVSIGTDDPYVQKVLLINLDTCDSYILTGLHGQLEGLVIK